MSPLVTHYVTVVDAIVNNSNCQQVLPKVISEERVALAQLCNKGTMGRLNYNGTPQIHLKTAPPFEDHHP